MMMLSMSWRRGARRWIAPLGLCLSIFASDGMAQPTSGPPAARGAAAPAGGQAARLQRAFATPEAAVKALIEALQAPTDLPLRGILGGPVLDAVPLSERQADDRRRAAGGWLALQPFEIAQEGGSRATALFGEAHVPLPALLVQTPRGWLFDQAGTIEAMRKRRIGVNEANALEALRALAAAQARYRLSERRTDGVLEYARRIRSSGPGKLDGLTSSGQEVVPGASTDLLNQAFGQAEVEPGDPRLVPPAGYAYRILTGQGPHAEGGAASYLAGDRLTEGFAVVAWPVRPGESGISTFIMNHRGTIFEQELGNGTVEVVRRMAVFDPGPGWNAVSGSE
ncbi:DUF2950 family protein [Dankookia sp. GCM10030260]